MQLTPSSLRYGIFSRIAAKVPGMLRLRRRMTRETAHVHLVDNQVLGRYLQRPIRFPVEIVLHDPGAMRVLISPVRFLAPGVPAADGLCVRVHEDCRRIKPMQRGLSFFRTRTRSVHAEPVLDVFVVEIEDDHRKDVPDPEISPHRFPCSRFLKHAAKRYFRQGFRFPLLEENQHAVVRVLREDREIDAAGHQISAEGIGATRTQA